MVGGELRHVPTRGHGEGSVGELSENNVKKYLVIFLIDLTKSFNFFFFFFC